MTAAPAPGTATAGDTGHDERHTPHTTQQTEQPQNSFSAIQIVRRTAPASRPSGRYASGYARALTPTPHSDASQTQRRSRTTVTTTPLDRPRSFRDDLGVWAEPLVGIEPTTFSLRGRLSALHTPSTGVFADTAARTRRRFHHGFPGFRTTCGTTRVAISSSSGKSALAGPSRFAGFLEPPLGLVRRNTSELSEDRRRPAGHGRPHDRLDQLEPRRTAAAPPRRGPRA
jgi:hypothetical protein